MSDPGKMTGNFSNSTEEQLEDFEVFDLRDAMNVGAYSLMSASKEIFKYLSLILFNLQASQKVFSEFWRMIYFW